MKQEGRKEGHVLFNDALNTFYLRLYGVRHMVKDHSDSDLICIVIRFSKYMIPNLSCTLFLMDDIYYIMYDYIYVLFVCRV